MPWRDVDYLALLEENGPMLDEDLAQDMDVSVSEVRRHLASHIRDGRVVLLKQPNGSWHLSLTETGSATVAGERMQYALLRALRDGGERTALDLAQDASLDRPAVFELLRFLDQGAWISGYRQDDPLASIAITSRGLRRLEAGEARGFA